MEAETERLTREREAYENEQRVANAALIDLPCISTLRGAIKFPGIVAAGGWCQPSATLFNLDASQTKKQRIAAQRKLIERQAVQIRKLKTENKKLRKIRKLEQELARG